MDDMVVDVVVDTDVVAEEAIKDQPVVLLVDLNMAVPEATVVVAVDINKDQPSLTTKRLLQPTLTNAIRKPITIETVAFTKIVAKRTLIMRIATRLLTLSF